MSEPVDGVRPPDPPPTPDRPAPPPTRDRFDEPPPTRDRVDEPPPTRDRVDEPPDSTTLPPSLAPLTIVGPLATQGGQGTAMLCTGWPGHELVVLKVLPFARPALPEVWALWRELAAAGGAVDLLHHNIHDGRAYEVTPFVPGLSLDRVTGTPMPGEQLHRLVKQLGDHLGRAHAGLSRRLVHRDVKPANILVVERDPLRVVFTDFGLSSAQDAPAIPRSVHVTEAYAAPEALAGTSHPPVDWWSLGMTVAELAQGHHPFQVEGQWLSPYEIHRWLVTLPVPLDEDLDPRLQLLLRGLLTRSPGDRWGAAQVHEWVEGRTPTLGEEWTMPAAAPAVPPAAPTAVPLDAFEFDRRSWTEPAELAGAFARSWRLAGGLLLGRRAGALEDWAARRSPELGAAVAQARASLDDGAGIDRAVCEIVVALAPDAAPVFDGRAADADGLRRLAIEAVSDRLTAEVIERLRTCGGLVVLSRLPGQEGLAELARRWAASVDAARARAATLPDDVTFDPVELHALLFAAAVDLGLARGLAQDALALCTRQARRAGWFRALAEAAAEEPSAAVHAVIVLSVEHALTGARAIRDDVREPVRAYLEETLAAWRASGGLPAAGGTPVAVLPSPAPTRSPVRWRRPGAAAALLAVGAVGAELAVAGVPWVLAAVALAAALAAAAAAARSRPGRRANVVAGLSLGLLAGVPVAGAAALADVALGSPVPAGGAFWFTWFAVAAGATTLGVLE
ncbi:MAG: protein kinase [Kineosporiaceae bacterium]|nr:protein kinase [Kineosporiaceae bacterium]